MTTVLLNVVPKELMCCWNKVTRVILAMVHYTGTELGTQGSMELGVFRIQSPTQPGHPQEHITGRSEVTHQCARVGGKSGVFDTEWKGYISCAILNDANKVLKSSM